MKLVAFTPPKVTAVAPVKLSPETMTVVPGGPLVGMKLEIVGVARNAALLKSLPLGVTTSIFPVNAFAGTVVVISVPPATTVNFAGVPSNVTLEAPVKLVPSMVTALPTLPDVGIAFTNGSSPMLK